MKILGISGSTSNYNKAFITEISVNEMMALVGASTTQRLGSGDVIKVTQSIERLDSIDKQPQQRAAIATQLRAMAEIIEMIPPIVIPAEQPKEGGDA